MNLRALHYFVQIAQIGSISRAALHLRVAQPALSRQLRKLEDELGARLLTRTAQGVTLTGPGETLMNRAERILLDVEEARLAVISEGQDVAGPVTLAAEPALGSIVAPLLVERLRAAYPNVTLSLYEGLTNRIHEGLISRSFDIGLMQTSRREDNVHLSVTPLLMEPLVFVGPRAQGSRHRKEEQPITLHELERVGLLLPSRPNALRMLVEEIAAEHDIQLNLFEDVDGMMILKSLVEHGLGYTIHSYSYVHGEVQKGHLSIRMIDSPVFRRQLSMACLRGRPTTMAVDRVMQEIGAIVPQLVASGGLFEYRPPEG